MEQGASRVFTDDTVSSAVLDIIRQANDHIFLVSPYNKFWSHLKNDIHLALQKGVRVTAVYRDGEEVEDIEWLGNEGATVYAVDKLHAKLFMNESSVLMTSMNLVESSSKNSMEVGIQVNEAGAKIALRDYVQQRLIPLGRQVYPRTTSAGPAPQRSAGHPQARPQPAKSRPVRPRSSKPAPTLGGIWDSIKLATTGGRCIRCKAYVPFDGGKPLCDKHFKEWSRFNNPGFEEKYCHRCGRASKTTYAKPLCYPCYQKVTA